MSYAVLSQDESRLHEAGVTARLAQFERERAMAAFRMAVRGFSSRANLELCADLLTRRQSREGLKPAGARPQGLDAKHESPALKGRAHG